MPCLLQGIWWVLVPVPVPGLWVVLCSLCVMERKVLLIRCRTTFLGSGWGVVCGGSTERWVSVPAAVYIRVETVLCRCPGDEGGGGYRGQMQALV